MMRHIFCAFNNYVFYLLANAINLDGLTSYEVLPEGQRAT